MSPTNYQRIDYHFDTERFFPKHLFEKITEIRVRNPKVVTSGAEDRLQRDDLTRDGKLTILAVDHTARGVTAVGGDPLRMGNRHELLGRTLRVVTGDEFDGVMGPPDLIDDLLIVNHLVKDAGGPSFLDKKVMIGCMQRGGVIGVAGEIDDRFGTYTAEAIKGMHLDGGKMMFRLVPEDERSLETIHYCALAVRSLNAYDLAAFLEPLPIGMDGGKYRGDYTVPNLVKLVCVAAGLGDGSSRTWLKVPYVDGFETVASATSLPILMLGGPAHEDPTPTIQDFATGMRAGSNVRGALVGRNVLFPGREDPLAMALAINGIVHDGLGAKEAIELLMEKRDEGMDRLSL